MTRYIAFLASMNVGGNRLKMEDLRDCLEREDIEDVETVIASGNVLFSYDDRPTSGLTEMFAYIVQERFGFPTFAAVRTKEELRATIENNPFAAGGALCKEGDEAKVHTIFLDEPADEDQFKVMLAAYEERDGGDEAFALGDRCLYVDYVDGVGRSKLTIAFMEAQLDRSCTARNQRSLKRILDKMEQ